MQQLHQPDEDSILLKLDHHGLPHPHPANCAVHCDADAFAALNHAVHHHALRMVKALDLGDLHSVEYHLDTRKIVTQQRSDCGDLWVRELAQLQD